ncbi:MAG TPA: EamA family transporter [Candidatus Obscuribacterales bacterium]
MSQLTPVAPATPGRSPVLLLLFSMASIHSGAAIAKGLFSEVSPLGLVTLRLGLGALVLVLWVRPRWRHHRWQDYRLVAALGLVMGVMNACLYYAIAYIPIGVAVTLEFLGPLGVALAYSRRGWDWLWVALAAAGVLLLAPVGGLTLHPLGIGLALISGGCWAAYIVLSAQVGKVFPGSEGVALAMTAGAIALLPLGVTVAGTTLLSPRVLGLGLVVAVLSSALPYSLEMAALRRLPVKVFGVLMSLEPAVASGVGLWLLGEQLSVRLVAAIVLVSLASAGVTWQAKGQP